MKKRIFAIALVVGVMLSVCGSAWATTNYYTISNVYAEYPNLYNTESRKGLSFTVRVRASISSSTANTAGVEADSVRWSVSQDVGNQIVDLSMDVDTVEHEVPISGDIVEVKVTGVVSGDGTIRVKASLFNGDTLSTNSSYQGGLNTNFATITFHSGTGDESRNTNFPTVSNDTVFTIKEVFEATEKQKADPDSEFWDGIDPKYPSATLEAQAALTADKGAKPKLGKIEKTALSFTSGTAGTLSIPITGGCPVVDVYIAAKDAIKLGWLAKGSTTDIQLNKANIKSFDIPFRINAENITTDTGKTASSTLTLAYNGANVAYKGFPITIEMKNSQASKEVKKAVKINVTPNTNEPGIYRDEPTELTKTVSVSMVSGDIIGKKNSAGAYVATASKTDTDGTTYSDYSNLTFKSMASGDNHTVTSGDYLVVSGDSATTGKIVNYDYAYEAYVPVKYDKKAKPKQVWDIPVPLTGSGDVEDADDFGGIRTFYVSGDAIAPYIITVKGTGKNGVSADITQPVYDNLGNVTTPGSVKIGGKLTNLLKETKTGITITATNPSTKKKGSVKVNVIGKVPAYFDKFVTSGDDKETKWITLTPKYVQAGKVPSAKAKAKGSKTIYYEGFSAERGRELEDFGLSFDMKKGTLVAAGNDKKKITPTINSDGDFDPLKVEIYAYNEIGGESIYTYVGVTGAKPSLNTKTVEFAASDYKNGAYKTFALNAGKEKPAAATSTAADIRATVADDSASVLSGLGLELVSWKSMDKVVSAEVAYSNGGVIRTSPDQKPYDIYSNDVKVADNAESTYVETAENGNIVWKNLDNHTGSKDLVAKIGNTTVTGNESLKNQGIIRVADYTKMKATSKQKINVVLDNIGAAGKGAVTLTIAAAATTSAGALPAVNKTVKVDANATAKKTNGTASLTYNGALSGKADADAEAEAEAEGTVTFGEPRTVADLTAGQQAFLAEKGYTVVAVLPEITADVSDQYKLEDIELDEDAPEGATLIWIAFPKNAPASEDDEIVDFYDEAGTPVEGVPASHKIIASPWLREAVTYEPVIAIEAK